MVGVYIGYVYIYIYTWEYIGCICIYASYIEHTTEYNKKTKIF